LTTIVTHNRAKNSYAKCFSHVLQTIIIATNLYLKISDGLLLYVWRQNRNDTNIPIKDSEADF